MIASSPDFLGSGCGDEVPENLRDTKMGWKFWWEAKEEDEDDGT
jgi:hypothetical protein